MSMLLEDEGSATPQLSFPVLPPDHVQHVIDIIEHLYSTQTQGNPQTVYRLQHELQQIQSKPEAWGLIAGLTASDSPHARFFAAHTAQVKISRDWDSLPLELRRSLLQLLLEVLAHNVSPSNPHARHNALIVRKLFQCLSSLLLRLPTEDFPRPLLTVLASLSGSTSSSNGTASVDRLRGKLWALEWLTVCVEEVTRSGLLKDRRMETDALLEDDVPLVMRSVRESLDVQQLSQTGLEQSGIISEADRALACFKAWVLWGLRAEQISETLPLLYQMLDTPLMAPSASAINEILSSSVYQNGSGSKILTEPIIAWITGGAGHRIISNSNDDQSEELVPMTMMMTTLIEHSADWLAKNMNREDVQQFLAVLLQITGSEKLSGVDDLASGLTLAAYPLIQEAVFDSDLFSLPQDSPEWQIPKGFFRNLLHVIQSKVRYPGHGDVHGADLGGLDREDRDAFETYRRDAGEVVVGAYYILREEMLVTMIDGLIDALDRQACWQDVEAILHCIRHSHEAVPLGEEVSLPKLLGEVVLGRLAQRPNSGLGEDKLRLTAICTIQAYEEWFKHHSDHLVPVLSYLVPALDVQATSSTAATALKALCDMCRTKLVSHIGAFSALHGKIGNYQPEDQTKVIEAITSVLQALPPDEAIQPVESIVKPIIERLAAAIEMVSINIDEAKALCVAQLRSLTACAKGLTPSEDDIFDDDSDENGVAHTTLTNRAREDARLVALRDHITAGIGRVVEIWSTDVEIADALSDLFKSMTASSDSPTLVALSPVPLLQLVSAAAERQLNAIWLSLASTLVIRIAPQPTFTSKKVSEQDELVALQAAAAAEAAVGDAAVRLFTATAPVLGAVGGMHEHPDIVEAWFRFSGALVSKYSSIFLSLDFETCHGFIQIGIAGLGAQERFSLKTAAEFFISLLASTRYPDAILVPAHNLLVPHGQALLRALILSAGSEGPRSVIPNLAELLAAIVTRLPRESPAWINAVLSEDGFPDARATPAAKDKFKTFVLKSRTTKKMREALNDFALVSRGLADTVYGNATI